MIEQFEALFRTMMEQLLEAEQKVSCLAKQIEQCFLIANRFTALVRHEVSAIPFPSIDEEIYFFRHIKPTFISQLEYYSLCYHAVLFKNEVSDPVKITEFWSRESIRLEKFIHENRSFYQYYNAGETRLDKEYFTALDLASHDPAMATVSKYDPLVSTLMALRRYHEFVVKHAKRAHSSR